MMRTLRKIRVCTHVLLGAVIVGCTLVSAMPATASTRGQADSGTVTGQVLTLDDRPLANVRLAAFAQAQSVPNRTPLSEFQTDAQGRYSVQVPPGQVWIHFETQDISGQSFWGYDNLPVDVSAGQTVSGQCL